MDSDYTNIYHAQFTAKNDPAAQSAAHVMLPSEGSKCAMISDDLPGDQAGSARDVMHSHSRRIKPAGCQASKSGIYIAALHGMFQESKS